MSVGTLSILFETAPRAVLQRDQLVEACGADIAMLLATGLLRETAQAAAVICASCDTPHRLSVDWSEERGALGRFCADGGGWAETSANSLQRFVFDHIQFLAALSQAFDLKRNGEPLVEDACWRLGATSAAGTEYTIVVAREMNDPRRLIEVAAALKQRVNCGLGLILCGARPIVDLGLFPRRYKAVVLGDVIALDTRGEIGLDHDAVATALGLIRRRRGEHGAPHDHPGLIELIDERERTGRNCHRAAEEADWLLKDMSWVRRGRPLPDREALRRFIGRRRTKSHRP